jgi:hypothetical protein
VGVEGWLTDRGAGELLGWALKGNLRKRIAEEFVGLTEEIGGHWVSGGQILAHTNCLGALTGKEKCCLHKVMM